MTHFLVVHPQNPYFADCRQTRSNSVPSCLTVIRSVSPTVLIPAA